MDFSQLRSTYDLPLFDLLSEARQVHKKSWPNDEVQLCTLLSIKTGGCSEDCSYCAQSSRYNTHIDREELLDIDTVMESARAAKAKGATRFCMGAAWRGLRDGTERFDKVLEIVNNVADTGLEVCVTLGEIGEVEAEKLAAAGAGVYNHNIDTSPEHYPNIVTTHTFDDRLRTLQNASTAGMKLCCGGIVGLGESIDDRLKMLEVLCSLDPAPESVPINSLVPISDTPLADTEAVAPLDLARLIATARIALPKTKIRLSAGRTSLSDEAQTLCYFAGANSIFYGDKLLTTVNPSTNKDIQLLKSIGLKPQTELPKKSAEAEPELANS